MKKVKITMSIYELYSMQYAIEVYSSQPKEEALQDELEIYRRAEMHKLLFWIKKKIPSMEEKGQEQTTVQWPFTHVLILHHILENLTYSRQFQAILKNLNRIKVNTLPIFM